MRGWPLALALLGLTSHVSGAATPLEPLGPAPASRPRLETLDVRGMTFHYAPPHETLARDLARHAPSELARVSLTLGLPAPGHVDVYLFPRRAELDPSRWGLPAGPDWAAGFTLSSVPIVVLRTDEDVGPYGNAAATVLTHELVHAVTSQALGPRHAQVPAWLREGVASALAFEWRLRDSADATRFALSGAYLPLADVTESFPADAGRAEHAYLEAFAFVTWLMEEHGVSALQDLFRRLERGEPFTPAFRAAYGASPGQLERRWKGGFLFRYRWVPVLTGSTTLWLAATALFVAAWIAKRRRAAARMSTWIEEDLAQEAAAGADPPEPTEGAA